MWTGYLQCAPLSYKFPISIHDCIFTKFVRVILNNQWALLNNLFVMSFVLLIVHWAWKRRQQISWSFSDSPFQTHELVALLFLRSVVYRQLIILIWGFYLGRQEFRHVDWFELSSHMLNWRLNFLWLYNFNLWLLRIWNALVVWILAAGWDTLNVISKVKRVGKVRFFVVHVFAHWTCVLVDSLAFNVYCLTVLCCLLLLSKW